MSSPCGVAGSGGSSATFTKSPDLTLVAGSRIVRPAIVTCPARISAFSRERDRCARCAARTRSSLSPASPAPIMTVSVTTSAMVQGMSDDNEKPLDPETARVVAKVRRLMMIATMTTFIAVAAVIAVIGYRVFKGEERVQAVQSVSATLPAGTKVLSSAIGEGRLVLTVEVNGAIELYSFDLNTLKPLGRVRLAQ